MFNLNLSDQNILAIQGAKKILSCTQFQAVIEAEKKRIVATGNNIEVKKLNLENGEVCLYGIFNNIKLADEQERRSLLKRIFK